MVEGSLTSAIALLLLTASSTEFSSDIMLCCPLQSLLASIATTSFAEPEAATTADKLIRRASTRRRKLRTHDPERSLERLSYQACPILQSQNEQQLTGQVFGL